MDMNIKNIILAGIGTIAYTYEKGIEIVNDMVKKGQLTISQGKDLSEELKRKYNINNSNKVLNENTILDDLKAYIQTLNLATKDDIEELKERIEKLENN